MVRHGKHGVLNVDFLRRFNFHGGWASNDARYNLFYDDSEDKKKKKKKKKKKSVEN